MHPEQSPPTRSGEVKKWRKPRAVGVAIGLTVAALLFSTLGSLIVLIPVLSFGFDVASPPIVIAFLVMAQLGFFLTGYLYVRLYGLVVPITRPTRRDLGYTVGGILAALGFATAAGAVLSWIGLTPEAAIEEVLAQDPILAIWLAVLSVFVIAPAEEYLFRGVVQGRLRRTFNAPSAIIGASLLFGSLHLPNFIGSLETILAWGLLIAGVGVIFGILYERTGTLTVPIIAHGFYNMVLFFTGYLLV